MDDTLLQVLTDVMTYLEMGHDVQTDTIIHEELREFLLASGVVSPDALRKNVKYFEDDGLENLTGKWQ